MSREVNEPTNSPSRESWSYAYAYILYRTDRFADKAANPADS